MRNVLVPNATRSSGRKAGSPAMSKSWPSSGLAAAVAPLVATGRLVAPSSIRIVCVTPRASGVPIHSLPSLARRLKPAIRASSFSASSGVLSRNEIVSRIGPRSGIFVSTPALRQIADAISPTVALRKFSAMGFSGRCKRSKTKSTPLSVASYH